VTCLVALAAATVLLLALGDRRRVANRILGLVAGWRRAGSLLLRPG
jgi:hypothetical protein